jgi:hypothetical protein
LVLVVGEVLLGDRDDLAVERVLEAPLDVHRHGLVGAVAGDAPLQDLLHCDCSFSVAIGQQPRDLTLGGADAPRVAGLADGGLEAQVHELLAALVDGFLDLLGVEVASLIGLHRRPRAGPS